MVEPSPSSEKASVLQRDGQPTAEQWLKQTAQLARRVVVDEPTERRAELILPALEVIAARARKRTPGEAPASGTLDWLLPVRGRTLAVATVAAMCGALLVVGAQLDVGAQLGIFGGEGVADQARVDMKVTPAEHAVVAAVELPGVRVELSGDTPVNVLEDQGTPPKAVSSTVVRRASQRSVAPASLSASLAKSVSGTAVTLAQGVGQATYRVDPAAERQVRVVAGGATISVKGTQFLVAVDAERVRVRVYRGVVEVDHRGRQRTIRADEEAVLAVAPANESHGATDEAPVAESTASTVRGTGSASARPPTSTGTRAASQELSPLQELVRRADAARSGGRHAQSVQLLKQLLREYPNEGRVSSWHFTLGRAYRATGQSRSAAQAFGASRRAAPGGVLAHDALAEEARAWASAGKSDKASSLARQYLDRYPKGNFASKMRSLLR